MAKGRGKGYGTGGTGQERQAKMEDLDELGTRYDNQLMKKVLVRRCLPVFVVSTGVLECAARGNISNDRILWPWTR